MADDERRVREIELEIERVTRARAHHERRIELEDLFPRSPIKSFAPVDGLPAVITTFGQIEEVADRVREVWALGLDPIPDLIDVLETNGIRVFTIDADQESKFDGLAARVGERAVISSGAKSSAVGPAPSASSGPLRAAWLKRPSM